MADAQPFRPMRSTSSGPRSRSTSSSPPMADQKASILMGATFVIFTIAHRPGARHDGQPLPLLILGGAAFSPAVCAVLAVMPATRLKPRRGRVNLLFFGSFTQLGEEEYHRPR